MVCIGWPLPQLGVPQENQWSALQMASQEFQNSVVMRYSWDFSACDLSCPL